MNSFGAIHMPARIQPFTIPADEYFRNPARIGYAVPALLEFVRISRVNDCGKAVRLNLGFRKFELSQLASARGEASRAF